MNVPRTVTAALMYVFAASRSRLRCSIESFVSIDKFDDMPCKLNSTASVSFTDIPRQIV